MMSTQQQQQQQGPNSASDQNPLSFDQVSNLFSLPLSEAADSLGVCRNVLKKICHDNGLVRWPYRQKQNSDYLTDLHIASQINPLDCASLYLGNRLAVNYAHASGGTNTVLIRAMKQFTNCSSFTDFSSLEAVSHLITNRISSDRMFLSGKSIEEIMKDAPARERNKELVELSKAAGKRSDASTSSAVSSLSSHLQNRSTTSVQDTSKSRGVTQQQVNKKVHNGRSQDLHNHNLTSGTQARLDEFKYGFPAYCLSTASSKWWGSSCPDDNEDIHGSSLLLMDREKSESGRDESNIGPQGTRLLTAVRKRAAEEGREALKLGVYRSCGVNKLGRGEKVLLLGIFKSALPCQWKHGSF